LAAELHARRQLVDVAGREALRRDARDRRRTHLQERQRDAAAGRPAGAVGTGERRCQRPADRDQRRSAEVAVAGSVVIVIVAMPMAMLVLVLVMLFAPAFMAARMAMLPSFAHPAFLHEVHRPAAGVVVAAIAPPVALLPHRHIEVHRRRWRRIAR